MAASIIIFLSPSALCVLSAKLFVLLAWENAWLNFLDVNAFVLVSVLSPPLSVSVIECVLFSLSSLKSIEIRLKEECTVDFS